MKLRTIIHIEWDDSEAVGQWDEISSVSEGMERIHSVGILVRKTKDHVLLALSYDPTLNSINCYKKIPLACIRKYSIVGKIEVSGEGLDDA